MENLGDTNVIEYNVSREVCNEIQDFETEMLNRYIDIIHPYFTAINKMGYELKVELGWANFLQKTWSSERLPLENGYECYVYCLVKKDGEEVCIKSSDGEADYYPLITSWMVSSVSRKWHRLKVSVYTNVDDVESDIDKFLFALSGLALSNCINTTKR